MEDILQTPKNGKRTSPAARVVGNPLTDTPIAETVRELLFRGRREQEKKKNLAFL